MSVDHASDDLLPGVSRTGGCLCGAVRFRFEGRPNWITHCHCESCRRATSSPLTTYISVALDGFTFTGTEPVAYASSRDATRRHCGRCGSPVSYQHAELQDEMHLFVAALDRSGGIGIAAHDFWSERVRWLHIADDLPKRD